MALLPSAHGDGPARRLPVALVFAVAYLLLSRLGFEFSVEPEFIPVLWPSCGVALAAFALADRRRLPELIAGALIGGFAAGLWIELPAGEAALLSAARALGPLAAGRLVRLVAGPDALDGTSVRAVGALLLAAAAANALTALAGAAVTQALYAERFADAWLTWWLTDALAMLALAPPLLLLAAPDRWRPSTRTCAPVAATVVVALTVFLQSPDGHRLWQQPYALIPLLVGVAFFGPHPASLAIGLTVAIACAATVAGQGPFPNHHLDQVQEIIALQGFLAAAAISTLMAAAVVHARRRAEQQALAQSERLAAALAEAEASERRYGQLVASMPGTSVTLYDAQLRCVMTDGPLLERLGVAPGGAIGRRLGTLMPAEAVAVVRPLCERALAGDGGATEYEASPDGAIYGFEAVPFRTREGAVEGVYVIMRDVTAQRRQDAAVRRAESDLRTVFRSAPVASAIASTGLELQRVNPALERLTGHPAERLERLWSLIHPDDRDAVREAVGGLAGGRREDASLETRLLHADGGTLVVWLRIVALPGDDRSGMRLLVQLVDATERIRREERLRHMADHDPLTGLTNRRRFHAELAVQLERIDREAPTARCCCSTSTTSSRSTTPAATPPATS